MNCIDCGDQLTEEEVAAPNRDTDGDVLCNECWSNEYLFECGKCEDYTPKLIGDVDYYGGIGSVFVSHDEYETGAKKGIYTVIKHPFYHADLFGAWLLEDAVEQLSPSTHGMVENHYPIAFLCGECAKKIKQEITAET